MSTCRLSREQKSTLTADDTPEFVAIAEITEAGILQRARLKLCKHINIAALFGSKSSRRIEPNRLKRRMPLARQKAAISFAVYSNGQFGQVHEKIPATILRVRQLHSSGRSSCSPFWCLRCHEEDFQQFRVRRRLTVQMCGWPRMNTRLECQPMPPAIQLVLKNLTDAILIFDSHCSPRWRHG
jgi:hypothetical protein